ncbi:DUF6531 domain-containing protein [Streptomyces olivaceiscleroticus]|uniref:Type IV secretion protein Rhs n=1 Tax=Streptomyces olivaceiscleroticus TaxID=68245 RepID=A0ABP3L3E6_9ACTN
MADLNPLHLINNVNHAMGESMADVLEFLGISDPAVDPDGVREIAKKWRTLADALDDADQDAGTALKDVEWEGKAAKAFHKRATKARDQAKGMAEALRGGAKALDQFADEAHEMITEIGVICVEIVEMEAAGLALSVLTAGVSAAATTIAAGARAARIIALIARIEESGTALARVIRGVIEVIRGLSRTLRALKEVKTVATVGRMAGEGMKFSALDAALQDPDAFKAPGKLAHVLGEGAALGVGFGVLGKGLGKGLKALKPSELGRLGKALRLDGSGLSRVKLRPGAAEQVRASIRTVAKRCERDPIDVATGDMLLHAVDISLPGTLSLIVERTHVSSYRVGGWFGTSWASTLDQRLQADDEGITYAAPDGARLVYPALEAEATEPVQPLTGTGPALTWDDETDGALRLTDADTGLAYVFHSPRPIDDATGVDLPLQAIIDRAGNRITVAYADDGTPSELAHAGGYRLALDRHRTQPRIAAIRLLDPEHPNAPGTTVVSYGYDEAGHLAEVVNSSGLPLRFTYDDAGRITSWTDRNDSSYAYTYDEHGRVARTEGSAGHLTGTLEYDDATHTTTVTDSLGHARVYEHDDAYRLIRETDPLGNTTHRKWDEAHRLISVTDPLGHTTRYHYDDRGRTTAVIHPDGTRATAVYNDAGDALQLTAPDGSVLGQEFDGCGNRISTSDPAGGTTRYAYTATGHLKAVTDPLGHTTHIHCDEAGLPTTVTDPLGAATCYDRDAFGRPVTITDPVGAVTRLEWSPEGNLVRRTGPGGAMETWTYDGEGNCTSYTDPHGGTATFEYTHFDLLAARTDPDGTRHTFTHDTELRLAAVTNPQGLTWNYTYDEAGRLTAESDFDDRIVTYHRDGAGRVTTRTTPLGEAIAYSHDALGRVITKDAAGRVSNFTYDPAGRLLGATNPDCDLSFQYDALGRVTAETINGRTTSHTYDPLGRRTHRTTPTGNTTRYVHDAAGRRTQLSAGGHTLAFTHDAVGRELTRTLDADALTFAYAWEPTGRLTGQTAGTARHVVRRRDYHYRADGYLTGINDSYHGEHHISLDAAGRVTAVTAQEWNESYSYDTAGNQASAAWPDNHPHPDARGERSYTGTRITRAGAIRYEHDAAGRLRLRRQARLSRKPDTWHYIWDAEDHLAQVITPDGTRWRYLYDPLGRRIAKERMAADGGTVLERVDFTWDGPVLIEQATTDPALLDHSVTLTWEHDGLHPISQTERKLDGATQAEIDTRFFAIATDLIGTPTELIAPDGDVAWHTRTTLWGTTTWDASATAYTPLRFPGQYYDPESGLHYNHHRYYDPATARYLTPDPLGLEPAPNPATYVRNPHTWSDVLGLAPCTVYHYTDEKGLQGILDSKEIWHSTGKTHARFGDGQYFTDISPDTVKGLKKADLTAEDVASGKISRYQLVQRLFGRPTRWGLGKTTHYIEIDVSDLAIGHGRPGVLYHLNDGPLDIANRIVRFGGTPS